jgi:hypothetical protein
VLPVRAAWAREEFANARKAEVEDRSERVLHGDAMRDPPERAEGMA